MKSCHTQVDSTTNIALDISKNVIPSVEGLDITLDDGVLILTLNRPRKLNALTLEMYTYIRDTLDKAGSDPRVNVCVLTGVGDYYCSGNDMLNFTKTFELHNFRTFVEAFIRFPKPLVCAVNGPAVGIAVTLLGLCDIVYSSDTATFHTPFMTLGLCPEGCSSYTFPKIMGYARANEMLLAGREITAREAFDRGLVTDIFPSSDFKVRVAEKIKILASMPQQSLLFGKALTKNQELETLMDVNEKECERASERLSSKECTQAVRKFLSKKNQCS